MRRIKLVLGLVCMALLSVAFTVPAMAQGTGQVNNNTNYYNNGGGVFGPNGYGDNNYYGNNYDPYNIDPYYNNPYNNPYYGNNNNSNSEVFGPCGLFGDYNSDTKECTY